MKKTLALLVLFLLSTVLCARPPQNGQAKPLAFTHVTVIDATGAPAKLNMTVMIVGDRITEIGKSGSVRVPKEAQVLDASGKFLIPGLWDMHVHHLLDQAWGKTIFLPLFIANGVTGVRDMGGPESGDPELVFQLRQQISEGAVLGPRMMAAGYMIDATTRPPKGIISVTNPAQARQAVDLIKKSGADFVKLHDLIPREDYFAVAQEAKKQGIAFVGHVPLSVDVIEAADAGQKSIEHDFGILLACSPASDEFRRMALEDLQRLAEGKTSQADAFRKLIAQIKRVDDSYSREKAKLVFRHLARDGTWVCPTFTVIQAIARADDPNLSSDPQLKYIPLIVRNLSWNPKFNGRTKNLTPEDYTTFKRHFDRWLEVVGEMRRAKVKLLAGTDTSPGFGGNGYVIPGYSLHEELALLARAGLSPMEALQAATRNPAEFFGMLDQLGTVEKGKLADLVLLDANPLEDIRSTQKISAVVANGHLLDRRALDGLLAQAEATANKK